jgi:hypothetical protein
LPVGPCAEPELGLLKDGDVVRVVGRLGLVADQEAAPVPGILHVGCRDLGPVLRFLNILEQKNWHLDSKQSEIMQKNGDQSKGRCNGFFECRIESYRKANVKPVISQIRIET